MKQEDNSAYPRDIKIRIVIIERDVNWINSLTLNIVSNEKDIMIVGSATAKETAVELVKTLKPDVVLIDTNITGNPYDGIDIACVVSKICKTKIIMLADSFDEDLICKAFAAGAVYYFFKTDIKHLPVIIRTIHEGSSVIEVLARDYSRVKAMEYKEKILNILSNAEKEVINLYVLGYKRKDIASHLGKTEDTIKNQVSSSYKKLNIGRRKELVEKLQL